MTKRGGWILLTLFLLLISDSYAQKKVKAFFSIDGYTEERAKAYFDANDLHSIEGIWQNESGDRYAIERFKDTLQGNNTRYRMIVLSYIPRESPTRNQLFFKTGYVRAFIDPAAVPYTYSVSYYVKDELGSLRVYPFVGMEYTTYLSIASVDEETRLFKVYPQHDVESANRGQNRNSDDPQGSGTAFALTSDGYLATCYHVIDKAKTIHIAGINGRFDKLYQAKVYLKDAPNDLAILKITDPAFIDLGPIYSKLRTVPARIGESCFAMGYPLLDLTGTSIKFTSGDISSITGDKQSNCYQFSATVAPGNSGGPLYDRSGNLLGIVSFALRDQVNFNYAIKSSYLKALLDALPDKTIQETGVEESTEQLADIAERLKKNIFLVYVNIDDDTRQEISGLENGAPEPPLVQELDPQPSKVNEALQQKASLSLFEIGRAYNSGEYDKALAGFENRDEPLLSDDLIKQGAIYLFHKKKYPEAIQTFNKAETFLKTNANLYFLRGMAYVMQEQYAEAMTDASTAIRINDRMLDAYFLRAQLKSKFGDTAGALSDLNIAIALFDPYEDSYTGLIDLLDGRAHCLLDAKQYREALAEVDKALMYDSRKAFVWETKGRILFSQGLYLETIQTMTRALQIAPSGGVYYWQGYAKYQLGIGDALEDLNRASKYGVVEAQDLIRKIKASRSVFNQ